MGIGFAANSMSMKCSPAYLQDDMLFHLPCLHNMQSISVFLYDFLFWHFSFGKKAYDMKPVPS